MKVVIREVEVSEAELDRRSRLGLDRWDEMWEGVLHMAPAPGSEHQRIHSKINSFFDRLFERTGRATVWPSINVFNESSTVEDYRIPDFSIVRAGRERLIAKDGLRGGGPDAVLEIRSPGDETYEKFPFFARLGIRDVVVIDRDTKQPEVHRLAGGQYVAVAADHDGWVASEVLGVRFRRVEAIPPRLAIEDLEDSTARVEI